jgi:NMD protein affecting ribosome stability and mRNA decay
LAAEKTEIEIRAELLIRVCRICGSLEERGKWLTPTARGLKEDLLAAVATNANRLVGKEQGKVLDISILRMPTSIGSSSILIPICIRTRPSDPQCPEVVRTFNAKIRLMPTTCSNCSLVKQKYYEATLQIRALSGEMSREEKVGLLSMIGALVQRAARNNKQAFISKLEENPAGFDLFLGTRQVAYAIASRFKAEKGVTAKETFKAGKVDKSTGKRKDKVTILIKLPKSKMDEMVRVRQ